MLRHGKKSSAPLPLETDNGFSSASKGPAVDSPFTGYEQHHSLFKQHISITPAFNFERLTSG